MEKTYEKLEIFRLSKELAVAVHKMTLTLPRYETYEEGSQIRRSSKSVTANIVEGYCLRRHKNEYKQDLHRALGSCDETILHIEFLFETGSLSDGTLFKDLSLRYDILGKKLFRFIEAVNRAHLIPSYLNKMKEVNSSMNFLFTNPVSRIANPVSRIEQ